MNCLPCRTELRIFISFNIYLNHLSPSQKLVNDMALEYLSVKDSVLDSQTNFPHICIFCNCPLKGIAHQYDYYSEVDAELIGTSVGCQ